MGASSSLLLLAVAAQLAPEHAARWCGQSLAAWDYVLQGVQACALWLAVGAFLRGWVVQGVAAYGATESALRPICRLAYPMHAPPPVPRGVPLCEAAWGPSAAWLSLAAAAGVAWLVAAHEPILSSR